MRRRPKRARRTRSRDSRSGARGLPAQAVLPCLVDDYAAGGDEAAGQGALVEPAGAVVAEHAAGPWRAVQDPPVQSQVAQPRGDRGPGLVDPTLGAALESWRMRGR